MEAPSVYQNISITCDSQGADESSPKPQKGGPGRPRLPGGPRDAGGWRYRIRTDLLAKQDGCCADCHRKEKLQLHKLCKGSDFARASNYALLCADCIRKKKEDPKTKAGWRYRIRKALQEKLGRKYQGFYMCPGCLKRKKLTLYRVNKGNNPPGESDYLLLCDPCRKKKQEERKKTKLWTHKPDSETHKAPSERKGTSKQTFYNSIRELVFERDGHKCLLCEVLGKPEYERGTGLTPGLGLVSFRPESKGGQRCFDNYFTCCAFHRGSKGDKLSLEYIWEKISFDYWMSEQLYHEPTATPGLITQRINLHLVAEISQFLMRIATNEDIEGKIRNKAERLNIKLSETDEDRGKERKAEVGSWIA